MKKTVLTTLSIISLTGLVGCNTNTPNGDEIPKQEVSVEGNENNLTSENIEVTENDFQSMSQVYGKIKSVVGNEIEVSLAKNPFEFEDEAGEENGIGDGELSASVIVTESIAVSPAVESEGGDLTFGIVGMDGQEPLELEYTGETKSFTIPTGTRILNFLTGGEGTFSDLKEGSVISITTTGDEGSEKIFSLDILE